MRVKPRSPNKGRIPASEIISAYRKGFGMPWWRVLLSMIATALGIGGVFRLADSSYEEIDVTGEQYFFSFLGRDKTDLEIWRTDDFDCDDFVFRLYGEIHKDPKLAAQPFMITWVRWQDPRGIVAHAIITYYKDGEVHCVEPQTDLVFPPPAHWDLDLVCG